MIKSYHQVVYQESVVHAADGPAILLPTAAP